MESEGLFKMIDEYFDDNLDKNSESILFLSLSNNENARNYFKGHHLLKSVTNEMQTEFPQELEKNILAKTIFPDKKKSIGLKMKPLFVYATVIISIFIGLFYYTETNAYKNDLAKINSKLENQSRTIESLINALPTAEVKGMHENEILIKSTKL